MAQIYTPVVEGYSEIRTDGNNSTYMQGLTHRYVGGELRFLNLALGGRLHEFKLPTSGTQTAPTRTWAVPNGTLNNFNGLWFEQAKNRLWITSAEDYTTTNHPARVTLLQLNDDGTAVVLKRFFLNIPAKRVYGGVQAVPASLVSALGGPYCCGWGGYTSLVAQGGGASIGPTLYTFADPDTIADGSTAPVRTILDTATSRGYRKTIPQNYFDGGDARQNPSSRPTVPPLTSAQWLSPNAAGVGWMVWGDSYYNTGAWVGDTYVALASLAKGAAWYQSSTLHFDGRQFEVHQWDGATLGSDPLKRPDRMDEVILPDGSSRMWPGNIPTGNIGGATYDPVTGIYYALGFPFSTDDYTGRLYRIRLTAGGAPPPPPPPPPVDADAVVSDWSAWTATSDWSACTSGTQTRTEQRTRTVITPSTGSGTTPPLSETRTVSQSCTVTPPPPPPPTDPTLVDIKTLIEEVKAMLAAPPLVTIDATVAGTPTRYSDGDYRIVLRVEGSALASAPASGATVRLVKD